MLIEDSAEQSCMGEHPYLLSFVVQSMSAGKQHIFDLCRQAQEANKRT